MLSASRSVFGLFGLGCSVLPLVVVLFPGWLPACLCLSYPLGCVFAQFPALLLLVRPVVLVVCICDLAFCLPSAVGVLMTRASNPWVGDHFALGVCVSVCCLFEPILLVGVVAPLLCFVCSLREFAPLCSLRLVSCLSDIIAPSCFCRCYLLVGSLLGGSRPRVLLVLAFLLSCSLVCIPRHLLFCFSPTFVVCLFGFMLSSALGLWFLQASQSSVFLLVLVSVLLPGCCFCLYRLSVWRLCRLVHS